MIWLSDNYVYWVFHPSIAFAGIQLEGLPRTIRVKNHDLFRKSEFHISLIDLERTAKLIDPKKTKKIQSDLIEETRNYLSTDELDKFKLSKEFRFVQKDIRKSVIVICELPGAENYFSMLREKYKTDIPLQPFHITLYALPKDKGIGLWSDEDIEKYTNTIELPELKNLRKATK